MGDRIAMNTAIVPGDASIVHRSEAAHPTVAAVIVTRNRIPMLRQTLNSVQESHYPISEIIVSDDSTNDETAKMLAAEFPDVIHIEGPKRGISANRNRGMSIAQSDFILLSDDDMLVDPNFVGSGLQKAQESKASLVFSAIDDAGTIILPNTLDFLGFSTKPYPPGKAYNTANQQCFLMTRDLVKKVAYDEVIEAYGYEEMDFAYRVAAAGHHIECVPTCKNVHLAPMSGPSRQEKNASRIYVTYKRLAYVDRRVLMAFVFLMVALPHHLIGSFRRDGMRGAKQALFHFRLAKQMLDKYRNQSRAR
jgi:GT2 family glycosyltransferase